MHNPEPVIHGTEFPVLGEPAVVELANTRYRDGDEIVDFLATPALTAGWFAASPTARSLRRPTRWSVPSCRRLATLRDAVDDVLRARLTGGAPPPAALAAINAAARGATRRTELRWTPDGPERADGFGRLPALDEVLGQLAHDAIDLLTGPRAADLSVCANDDCALLFVRHHHRRRWCHESCGHRRRQADYYRRQRAAAHTLSAAG